MDVPLARRWPWAALAAALVALLPVALRSTGPDSAEREVSFQLAAQSLAWDGDLAWDRGDYDRHLRIWQREPGAVALERLADRRDGRGSGRLGFARPPAYAVFAAPFVRVSPQRGPAVLNWLLLALTASLSAFVLARRGVLLGPVWVGICVAGTTAFALLPLGSPGLFRLAMSGLAWALAVQAMPPAGVPAAVGAPRKTALRWSLIGCFGVLSVVSAEDGWALLPSLLALIWLAAAGPWRRVALPLLVAAGALTAGASSGVEAFARGGFGPVEQRVFDRVSGFPAVDFDIQAWSAPAARLGGDAGSPSPGRSRFDLRAAVDLRLDAARHALVGRSVGLIPWGVPLLFAAVWGLFAGGWRRVALFGALGCLATRVLAYPFDLGDGAAPGPAGIGALLPLFWFLPGRFGGARLAVVAVSAAAFVYPLWRAPGALFGAAEPSSGALHRFLPVETTERQNRSGREDLFVGKLWLRPLVGELSRFGDGRILIGEGPVEFLVAWEGADEGPRLDLDLEGAATRLQVAGAEIEAPERLEPDEGGVQARLALDPPIARHRMWWSNVPVAIHRLRLELTPDAVSQGPRPTYRIELRPG